MEAVPPPPPLRLFRPLRRHRQRPLRLLSDGEGVQGKTAQVRAELFVGSDSAGTVLSDSSFPSDTSQFIVRFAAGRTAWPSCSATTTRSTTTPSRGARSASSRSSCTAGPSGAARTSRGSTANRRQDGDPRGYCPKVELISSLQFVLVRREVRENCTVQKEFCETSHRQQRVDSATVLCHLEYEVECK